jgi:hypothetical protein
VIFILFAVHILLVVAHFPMKDYLLSTALYSSHSLILMFQPLTILLLRGYY